MNGNTHSAKSEQETAFDEALDTLAVLAATANDRTARRKAAKVLRLLQRAGARPRIKRMLAIKRAWKLILAATAFVATAGTAIYRVLQITG